VFCSRKHRKTKKTKKEKKKRGKKKKKKKQPNFFPFEYKNIKNKNIKFKKS